MKTTILNSVVAAAAVLTTGTAFAVPPMDHKIEPIAGNCGIGTIPQTSKAGEYNLYCNTMADGLKCLALIKQHLKSDGTIGQANGTQLEKATYCVDLLKADLLGE